MILRRLFNRLWQKTAWPTNSMQISHIEKNPLTTKINLNFNNSVPTTQQTLCAQCRTSRLMLNSENRTKNTNIPSGKNWELFNVKRGSTHNVVAIELFNVKLGGAHTCTCVVLTELLKTRRVRTVSTLDKICQWQMREAESLRSYQLLIYLRNSPAFTEPE
jgi:hypothetical protein